MACCILYNISVNKIKIIDEKQVIWDHLDEGYIELVNRSALYEEAGQL